MADRKIREGQVDKKYDKYNNLRQERLQREQTRWDKMEQYDKKQEDRLIVKTEVYQAAKKNQGGAAYNIVNLDYD